MTRLAVIRFFVEEVIKVHSLVSAVETTDADVNDARGNGRAIRT
jgi:hypothetical protein